jgi:glucosamine-6-phosphate deaminase
MPSVKVEVLPDDADVAVRAAACVCAEVRERPEAWLGLPTGFTPVPMYTQLGRLAGDGACALGRATACAIDEFCDPSRGPGTNTAFYARHLPAPLPSVRCPDPGAADPAAEVHQLAAAVRQHGGLDLCVLGVGENGHVAFNEPGSTRDSRARVIRLAEATRRAHADAFGGLSAVPLEGMTLGVADLLASRKLVVLATGVHKATIVRQAIEGPATARVPASWLRHHADVTWLLDNAAASELSNQTAG